MEYGLLRRVTDGEIRVRELDPAQMNELAAQIRAFLTENVTKTGGHLASNLGVVELTLALHASLDLPKDHLLFDVGHQCYVHKLLTGRADAFPSLRSIGGLSGFPKRSESEYDCFGTGHSSTSLSAAIGFAEAEAKRGTGAYTVAVVGDGAFTGGMIHEALNNCRRDLRLILILNENEMSISKNIGSFASLIARIRASRGYYKTKNRTGRVISRIPLIGKPLFNGIRRIKQTVKNMMYHSNYFEELGLYYLGPVDGNDTEKVRLLIEEAKQYGKSAVIHIKTQKGKGYPPAEREPDRYHCIPPAGNTKTSGTTFPIEMGKILCELARKDPSICAVTAAMSKGTGLEAFRLALPERFFDVGIAEEHAVTFCAGLCAAGMKPFFAVYSSFLQRAYDNILHDAALQSLPIVLCVDRAGLNAGDGATHHGVFDVSFLSGIPGIRIFAPASFSSLRDAMTRAVGSKAICAIRYANREEDAALLSRFSASDGALSPRADFSPDGEIETVFLTYGAVLSEVLAAEKKTAHCGTVLLEELTPDRKTAEKLLPLLPANVKRLVYVEEGVRSGGAGMNLFSLLDSLGVLPGVKKILVTPSDLFRPIRTGRNVYASYGIGEEDILAALAEK